MRAASKLLQQACKITLFTRASCSLCSDAKQVLSNVWDKKPFEYEEIDVMTSGQDKWRGMYEFDTPVIHVQRTEDATPDSVVEASQKLMHRFKEAEVEKIVATLEQSS